MRKDSIVGKRAGTIVVLSSTGDKIVVQCDCGRVRTRWATAVHGPNPTCGDLERHPRRKNIVHGLYRTYIHQWHKAHTTCAGWEALADLARDLGERPDALHYLHKTNDDVAACGACDDCHAIGASRNIIWALDPQTRAQPVKFGDDHLSRPEIAKLLGVTREAVRYRLMNGVPLERPKSPGTKGRLHRCKICGGAGHFAKTCARKAAVS